MRDWCLTIVGYGEWESVYKDFINKWYCKCEIGWAWWFKEIFWTFVNTNVYLFIRRCSTKSAWSYADEVVPIAFDDCMAIRGFLINDVNSKVIKSLDISEYSRSIYDVN